MDQQNLLAEIGSLIARDELTSALEKMRSLLENTPQLNEVLQQSGRLANVQQQLRLGLGTQAELSVEQNRIRYGILELLSEMERQATPSSAMETLLRTVEQESARPELQEEFIRAISVINSKNLLLNSTIQAGGDIHFGDNHIIQQAEKIYNINRIDQADFS